MCYVIPNTKYTNFDINRLYGCYYITTHWFNDLIGHRNSSSCSRSGLGRPNKVKQCHIPDDLWAHEERGHLLGTRLTNTNLDWSISNLNSGRLASDSLSDDSDRLRPVSWCSSCLWCIICRSSTTCSACWIAIQLLHACKK